MIVTKFRQKGRGVDMTDWEVSCFLLGLMRSTGFGYAVDYIREYAEERGVEIRNEEVVEE